MQDFQVSYLPSIIILLFLIRLGTPQQSNGGDISSGTNKQNTHENADYLLKRLLEMKRTSPQEGPKYRNINSSAELRNIVSARFRTEMAVLFSRLPESDQCDILVAVSNTTQCTVSDIIELLFSLTEMKQNINASSCPVGDRTKLKLCSQANRTSIGETFCNELLNVFKSLPSPFKCHIINAIALAYSVKGRRNLALSVSQTQSAVAEIFPSVNLPNTCADLEMDDIIPSIPPVNITVDLNNSNKQSWLQTLTKKGPEIYKTVLMYDYEKTHRGKLLGPTDLAQYLKVHELNSTQLVTVEVGVGSRIFSVLFRLRVKRNPSNRLREFRSTYRIVEALEAKNQQELREIFNATIIAISLDGERSNISKSLSKTGRWTFNQMHMAKELFPADLSEYYKQLVKPARCFVVFYISLKIDKSPLEVEMFYSSFKRILRKHTCFYTRRTGPTETTFIKVFTHERFTGNALSTQAFTTERTPSTVSVGAVDHISDKVDIEDLSSLEIALFALLGVLCACVLAFTINCVMLALKVKPADQSNGRSKPVLQTAVFHKSKNVAGCKETEGVHFTDTNGSNCQQSNTEHLPKVETVVCSDKSCNCLYLVSSSTPHNIRRCDYSKTCLKCSQPVLHNKSGAKRTNSRTQLENGYCLDSSTVARTCDTWQLCVDDRRQNSSPDMEESSSKTECQCPRRLLDSHQGDGRVLESQGKAISYCSISDTSYKEHLSPKMKHNGCLPTEESHETVIVLLDCKGFKEVQV